MHAVAYNGVACNLQNAQSGQYPGVRNYYEVTSGTAKGAASAFISWIQKSPRRARSSRRSWIPLN